VISVQSALLVALGFFAASLLGLLVASAFWSRAVRLTTARIKQSMPVSEPEMRADRDRLRAEYAIKVHKLGMQLDQAKLERARQLIDINRRDASISTLETDVVRLKADLEENQNARRVLEQTVADRLPRVEARLTEAKRLLFNRDREIAELTAGARRHKQAMEEASSINAQKNAQIERLSTSLTTRGGRGRRSGGEGGDAEVVLRSEVEALRNKASEQALLIDRLQRRLGTGFQLSAPAGAASAAPLEGQGDKALRDMSEAEPVVNPGRAPAAPSEASTVAFEREVRALKARTEDQAGEIARLKAALATFEEQEKTGGLKDTRIALRARLGSAQAQADQQVATIAKLRAELAAAHERLARQAAHFMGEMRRIGSAPTQAGAVRRPVRGEERRTLAERVAQVRAVSGEAETSADGRATATRETEAARLEPAPPTNGRSGDSVPPPEKKDAAEGPVVVPAAAQLPQPGDIPDKRRRPRLLDRITGLGKG
jgi:chromosome segregation ATPase